VLNLIDDQIFRSLHGGPAFRQLLVKIGLPPNNWSTNKNQSENLSLRVPNRRAN
jgi:hypothetical protein